MNVKKKLLSLYGLKWNPFSSDVPVEALRMTPAIERFCWHVEHVLLEEGGFGVVNGAPGLGKSVALRLLDSCLSNLPEVSVNLLTHPSGSVSSFYRELGDLFHVPLSPRNRWGGFKALRERWQEHIENTLLRPVLLVDESQEVRLKVLNELRLLTSTHFDSRIILTVVFAGDSRFTDKLRSQELLPLGSRIRTRLNLEPAPREELLACLDHLLEAAGNRSLMTPELERVLCEHALGNYRVLVNLGAELLAAAAEQERSQLDENLYLEVFAPPGGRQASPPPRPSKRRQKRKG